MKKIITISFIFVSLGCFCACSDRRSDAKGNEATPEASEDPVSTDKAALLVGVWKEETPNEDDVFAMEFTKDGRTSYIDQKPTLITIGYRGVYVLSEDRLEVTIIRDDSLFGFQPGEVFKYTVAYLSDSELHLESEHKILSKFRRN